MENEIILYRKHANGIGTWKIWNEENIVHILHAQVEGGQEIHHTETVEINLSGRSLPEQIALRMKSRISRVLDKGYKLTKEEALLGATNQLGLKSPMLAQPIQKVKRIDYKDAILQPKLDGYRGLVTRDESGKIIAYTRQGKLILSITHITDELEKSLPDGITLDGELYCHGIPLQTIGSWIKRNQQDTKRLNYVVYDQMSDDTYIDRLSELNVVLSMMNPDILTIIANHRYEGEEQSIGLFKYYRNLGYEGLILRTNDQGYQSGIRSQSLIKIKQFLDGEFRVVEIHGSKENWAVCTCEMNDGSRFGVSAPGTKDEKTYVLHNQDKFIGKFLTVEYSVLTNDGIPFHPTATKWMMDIEGD